MVVEVLKIRRGCGLKIKNCSSLNNKEGFDVLKVKRTSRMKDKEIVVE
jgi:hypothetical protein